MNRSRLIRLSLAWLIALGGTLLSLYYGEVEEIEPCWLCWMQRIFLFPLPILLGISLYQADPAGRRYALPLACLGFLFSLYHNLSFLFPELGHWTPCSQMVQCSDPIFWAFGFFNLPLVSLFGFFLIILLLL